MTANASTARFTFDDDDAALDDRGLVAALYGRQSKGKAASIADQFSYGEARAVKRGWAGLVREQDKISASRHEARERDGWPVIVGLVERAEVGVVWLWESSRGDRTRSSWNAFLEACERAGVLIYVECDHRLYDVRQARDMRNLSEDGNDNAYESDKIAQRTMRAKNAARRDGNLRRVYGGNPPLGLRNGDDDWVTEPRLAAIMLAVAEAFLTDPDHNFAEAYSEHVPAGTADSLGRPVSITMMRAALQRPASAGLMVGRDGEPLGYESCIDGPPLDPATWRRLRGVFAGRKAGRPADAGRYPLGVLLRCGRCGNQLTGTPIYYRRDGEDGAKVVVGKPTPSYACRNPHKRIGVTKPCHGCSIAAEDVHTVIRAAVEAWAEAHPDYLAAAAAQPATGSREAELAADLARAQDELADLFANRRRLGARFGALRADLDAEIDRITAEIDALARIAASPLPAEIDWPNMTAAEFRSLVAEALVTPIIVAPGKRGLTALDRMSVEPRP